MSNQTTITKLFEAGAHYGYSRSRRNPSVKNFIFGTKNGLDIINLEVTEAQLTKATLFVQSLAASGKQILFITSKHEARSSIKNAAESAGQPFVVGRWIGGTITNNETMKERVKRLETLRKQKEKGDLVRYTKKERLLIDREIEDLEERFGGISDMKDLPAALFVLDSKKEHIAIKEAKRKGIPVIGLCGTDCDISGIDYPIVANDSSKVSVEYIVGVLAAAYSGSSK